MIQYYIKRKKDEYNDYSPKSAFLKKIYKNLGLKITHPKFQEIALYYIRKKLLEYLSDPKDYNLFINPIISPEGDTFNYNKKKAPICVENHLASKICQILRNKNKLDKNDLNKLKQLFKDKKTGKYFKNPIVISSGKDKGETIEGDDNVNKCYRNKVILNIINEIEIILIDDFFNFEEINYNDYNDINNNENDLEIKNLKSENNKLIEKIERYKKKIDDLQKQIALYNNKNNDNLHFNNNIDSINNNKNNDNLHFNNNIDFINNNKNNDNLRFNNNIDSINNNKNNDNLHFNNNIDFINNNNTNNNNNHYIYNNIDFINKNKNNGNNHHFNNNIDFINNKKNNNNHYHFNNNIDFINNIDSINNNKIKIKNNNNHHHFNNNINSINNNKNNNINNKREVTISKDNKNYMISIDNNISFEKFKIFISKNIHININEKITIYYFNSFGRKIYINNEEEFKKALTSKVFKYYIIKENIQQINYAPYNKIVPPILKTNKNKDSKTPESKLKKNKYIYDKETIIINNEQKKIKEIIDHFASVAFLQNETQKEEYINSAVYVSDLMNNINNKEKKYYPDKFIEPKQILNKPGLICGNSQKEDNIFILSLISIILEEKNINSCIYKDNQMMNKLDGASLQYLFGGLTEKNKFKIFLNLDENNKNKFKEKKDDLTELMDLLKTNFSIKLKTNKNDILLVNPKYNNGYCCVDLVSEDISIKSTINKLKEYNYIQEIQEKPLIEGCQLNSDIFDPAWNNQDGGWGIGEKRGGEDYIPPLGWFGYGLKVNGKYDNGNNNWLGMIGENDGEFAVAYFGISNIYGNKNNMKLFFKEIISQDALKMGYEQTYKNDIDLRNPSQKCGSGIYLFQNPVIAENTAGIINIAGVRYKILLMCRVNPKRIRQPVGFKDCWILNSSPFEIRPYRILIKKIFISPMAKASQEDIKTFSSTPLHIKDIFKKKDISFYYTNNTEYSYDNYVINLYTQEEGQKYKELNYYLREGKLLKNAFYNELQIKSWAFCLFNAINKKKNNVRNGTICYRGVAKLFPKNLDVGSQFIFSEFTSTSVNKEMALNFTKDKNGTNGTLMKIRIENNNNPNYYCYYIALISDFPEEEEILIVCNCIFQITKIKVKNGITKVNMTCKGFKFD